MAKKLSKKNGLSKNTTNIQLGGTLETNTNITYSGAGITIGYSTLSSAGTVYVDANNYTTWQIATPSPSQYWTATPNTYRTIVDDTNATISPYNFPIPTMLFENEIIKITEKGEVLINGTLELNPTKIGKAILQALEKFRQDDLSDPKKFFNKD